MEKSKINSVSYRYIEVIHVFYLKNLVSGMEKISSYGSRHLNLLDAVHVPHNKLVPALRSLLFWT